jgi:nucleoside-diphosphate-sugar epimerase/glycosyltransferase involved in cell wall biosynthesis
LDPTDCIKVVSGVDIVLHFAANMGGMGVIHEANDFIIYKENHLLTMNIFSAAKNAGVPSFFYASSACVYPASAQANDNLDIALKEDDVWNGTLPAPQGLYGLEKLHSEVFIQRGAPPGMKIYIARFHNIFGPRGSWRDGTEKAPAAFLRKCLVVKKSGDTNCELWGDGSQRRSFCYISDAIEGVLRLVDSDCHVPVNIGSDKSISMRSFMDEAACAVGVDPSTLNIRTIADRPVGVASRNSDNTFLGQVLNGWRPKTTLMKGMEQTGKWIEGQMLRILTPLTSEQEASMLKSWKTSRVVYLEAPSSRIIFAILLPVTSRLGDGQASTDCLASLERFSLSLHESLVPGRPSTPFHVRVYLAIDHDDEILNVPGNPAAERLRNAGIADIVTLTCRFPRGRVCSLWRECAWRAWTDKCDYYVLMGDDVELPSEAKEWQTLTQSTFVEISEERSVPFGFGCVAFTDVTFPGMPTFPIIHRTHLDIFHGQVVPDVFVNQDGDPYLFQLYRRFGCARMMKATIRNTVGGSEEARYQKLHTRDWTFGPLDEGTTILENFLDKHNGIAARKVTVDVIIPCYRVIMEYLERFLTLESSNQCDVNFIIIVDNPASPQIKELENKYGHRSDVRIRVNPRNLGASASRNRGLSESAAEWVLFLDDDVVPEPNILYRLEEYIRSHPKAAGFVGNALFPIADSIFTTSVHLAGVTYFWDIAEKMIGDSDVPWGVTANIAARRSHDNIAFDLSFPKTGGGEDIDYCRKKRDFSISRGGHGFVAAPKVTVTHPYWNGGRRSYWRFYMWSKGDGALIKLYPDLVYMDYAPNAAELLLLACLSVAILSTLTAMQFTTLDSLAFYVLLSIGSVTLGNIIHDLNRHFFRNPERTLEIKTTISRVSWVLAVLESTFIRIFSELGRLVGMLERGEVSYLMHRFDWFAGHSAFGDGPRREERRNSMERFGLCIMIAVLGCYLLQKCPA